VFIAIFDNATLARVQYFFSDSRLPVALHFFESTDQAPQPMFAADSSFINALQQAYGVSDVAHVLS
jgi:hypothetical protein